MSKSSREKILSDEKKILMELRMNSRLSFNELAEKCGFSRQKVWRIVKNLEENNIIWGYNTVIDDEKIGLNQFLLLLKRKSVKPKESHINIAIDRLIKKYMQTGGIIVQGSYYTHGEFDWVSIISGKNIVEIKKFTEILKSKYHDIIQDIKILEVLFPLEKCGIENPKKKNLKKFFND
jgi:DNA-binding Lrp family transcriptional regulator